MFVRQYPYGTGGFETTFDCVTDMKSFQLARLWSLCGGFKDDSDVQWVFWQRQLSHNTRLAHDLRFQRKFMSRDDSNPPRSSGTPTTKGSGTQQTIERNTAAKIEEQIKKGKIRKK